MPSFSESLKTEYQRLFDSCVIRESKYPAIGRCVQTIVDGKKQYEAISVATGVPWYFVGITHLMECSCNFKKHLHNGDPLTARTAQVPKGCGKLSSECRTATKTVERYGPATEDRWFCRETYFRRLRESEWKLFKRRY